MIVSAVALTVLAGIWRWADGRGIPRVTGLRNAAGLIIALGCAYVGMGLTWQAGLCALLASLTMIAGRTKWESWVSLARYGGPSCAIAVVGYFAGVDILPLILYAVSGLLVGCLYVGLHRYAPDFGLNTAIAEIVAGAVIIGGISWL